MVLVSYGKPRDPKVTLVSCECSLGLSVYEHSVWRWKSPTRIQTLLESFVVGFEPITNEQSEVCDRERVRDRDSRPCIDIDSSESTGGFVESGGRKVVVSSDLIFGLELVSEV